MQNFNKLWIFGLALLFLHSCAVKKYMPEDEYLFRGGKINLKTLGEEVEIFKKADLQEELEDVLYPIPNSRFLGMYPKLHYYYVYHEKDSSFWRTFMYNRMGEKPAYFSDMDIKATKEILQNRLENNGIYHSKIKETVKVDSSAKTAKIKFDVEIGQAYTIKSFKFEADSSDVAEINQNIFESLEKSVIKLDEPLNLNTFKAERERIDQYLKDRGYYYFNKDFLIFEVDTNQRTNRGLDLYLKLKRNRPRKAKLPYVIDSIKVLASVYNDRVFGIQDTVTVNGVDIIQNKANRFFKPQRLRPFILLEPGQYYDSESSKSTSRRLSNIGTYKFVNIQHMEADTVIDEDLKRGHLKTLISLSPYPKRRIQLRMEGVTKSNDFTGPGLGSTYTNRNIFKGGEDFDLDANFGYERQFSKKNAADQSLSLGIKASLLFPRLIFLWKGDRKFEYAIPKTKISVGMDYLNRKSLYSLNSYSGSFGYIWDQNRFVNHRLNLLNIDYIRLSHTSDRFNQILDENPFLKKSFEQQFIAGITYTFTYNELSDPKKRGRIYFQYNLDIAGNGLSLMGHKQDDGTYTFLGLRYAQYIKGDVDVSYHFDLDRKGRQTLVGHIFAGYGRPYGNSKALPFVKQYFAGGPYSLRAFRIRGIGPGTYEPEPSTYSYFDQAGDIRLEANIEYRFPMVSFLKGALFADAGNVWLEKENEALPGGKFTKNFYNELGFGTGFGIRLDVQGFVIRLDLSSSLKTPNGKWDFDYKHPMFNFGIGYPF